MSETDKPTIVEAGEPVSIEEAFAAPELCVWQQYLTRLFGQVEWKQYSTYSIKTDPDQDDKATEIKLCSFARPHMRAFHCSWWCFFIAFFIWFAIAPLLSEIRDDIGITKQDVWTSSIVGVGGTILMRFIMGPMCDKYGARFLLILSFASIPTACTGCMYWIREQRHRTRGLASVHWCCWFYLCSLPVLVEPYVFERSRWNS
jgi:Na+/melibiose symporter-like transporter